MIGYLTLAFLITGLLMLGGRSVTRSISLLAAQSLALSMIAFYLGLWSAKASWHMMVVGGLTLVIKVIVLPWILYRLADRVVKYHEVPISIGQGPSMLIGVLLVGLTYSYVVPVLLKGIQVGGQMFPVALSTVFVQKDIKRLLAYSSVEHVGIIVLGFGLGGVLGYTGALLHLVNHALGKSVLFLSAGTLAQKYHSKLIPRMKGIGQLLPVTATVFMASLLAIGGAPPFGLFISELGVASRGFQAGGMVLGFVFLMIIAVVFAGLIYFAGKMYFSDLPTRLTGGERFSASHLLLLPLGLLILQGIYMPGAVQFLKAVDRL